MNSSRLPHSYNLSPSVVACPQECHTLITQKLHAMYQCFQYLLINCTFASMRLIGSLTQSRLLYGTLQSQAWMLILFSFIILTVCQMQDRLLLPYLLWLQILCIICVRVHHNSVQCIFVLPNRKIIHCCYVVCVSCLHLLFIMCLLWMYFCSL